METEAEQTMTSDESISSTSLSPSPTLSSSLPQTQHDELSQTPSFQSGTVPITIEDQAQQALRSGKTSLSSQSSQVQYREPQTQTGAYSSFEQVVPSPTLSSLTSSHSAPQVERQPVEGGRPRPYPSPGRTEPASTPAWHQYPQAQGQLYHNDQQQAQQYYYYQQQQAHEQAHRAQAHEQAQQAQAHAQAQQAHAQPPSQQAQTQPQPYQQPPIQSHHTFEQTPQQQMFYGQPPWQGGPYGQLFEENCPQVPVNTYDRSQLPSSLVARDLLPYPSEHSRNNIDHLGNNIEHSRNNIDHPGYDNKHAGNNSGHPGNNIEYPRNNTGYVENNIEHCGNNIGLEASGNIVHNDQSQEESNNNDSDNNNNKTLDHSNKRKKPRKKRITFMRSQLEALELEYAEDSHPTLEDKERIAKELYIDSHQSVAFWFKNRRAADKKNKGAPPPRIRRKRKRRPNENLQSDDDADDEKASGVSLKKRKKTRNTVGNPSRDLSPAGSHRDNTGEEFKIAPKEECKQLELFVNKKETDEYVGLPVTSNDTTNANNDKQSKEYQYNSQFYPSVPPGHQNAYPCHQNAQPGHKNAQTGHQNPQPGYQNAQPGHQSAQPGHHNAPPGHQNPFQQSHFYPPSWQHRNLPYFDPRYGPSNYNPTHVEAMNSSMNSMNSSISSMNSTNSMMTPSMNYSMNPWNPSVNSAWNWPGMHPNWPPPMQQYYSNAFQGMHHDNITNKPKMHTPMTQNHSIQNPYTQYSNTALGSIRPNPETSTPKIPHPQTSMTSTSNSAVPILNGSTTNTSNANASTSNISTSSQANGKRRTRYYFKEEQVGVLLAEYDTNPKPDWSSTERIARYIGVDEKKVSDWFRNRYQRDLKSTRGKVCKTSSTEPNEQPTQTRNNKAITSEEKKVKQECKKSLNNHDSAISKCAKDTAMENYVNETNTKSAVAITKKRKRECKNPKESLDRKSPKDSSTAVTQSETSQASDHCDGPGNMLGQKCEKTLDINCSPMSNVPVIPRSNQYASNNGNPAKNTTTQTRKSTDKEVGSRVRVTARQGITFTDKKRLAWKG